MFADIPPSDSSGSQARARDRSIVIAINPRRVIPWAVYLYALTLVICFLTWVTGGFSPHIVGDESAILRVIFALGVSVFFGGALLLTYLAISRKVVVVINERGIWVSPLLLGPGLIAWENIYALSLKRLRWPREDLLIIKTHTPLFPCVLVRRAAAAHIGRDSMWALLHSVAVRDRYFSLSMEEILSQVATQYGATLRFHNITGPFW